ncbi:MAG TPA: hemerythrin domain-containing protein [Bacteroidota bacterium]|nr:hemerythrin domain-containing protein [Bacteroidota bacterium]
MTKATDILKNEHRAIERGLTVLEHCVSRLESGERVSAGTLADILKFIRTFADKCHHGKEEGYLFPALERSGLPRQTGPLAVMQAEHDEGRRLVGAMAKALDGAGSGDPASVGIFCRSAYSFTGLLRDHISKEDNVLFVMADMRLPDKEQERLAEDFHAAETTGEACMMKSELLRMLDRLETEMLDKSGNPAPPVRDPRDQ